MSTPDAMSAALAFVPSWWQETTDPRALDALLIEWSRVCEWRSCGFVWPSENSASVVKTIQDGRSIEVSAPPEIPDAVRRIRCGESTVWYSIPGTTGRVFACVQPVGRSIGVVWAERAAGQPWSESDRAYLALTARMMERSPAVAAVVGPILDTGKLDQRLADTATVAGRMAHDFDNILTGIIGFADLTVPMLQPGSQAAQFVGEIGKVGQRGIQFTLQLHQLSRSGQVKPNPSTVSAAVAKEESRLRSVAGPNMHFEKDLPLGLPSVALDGGPLQTIFGHLLENAVEACPHGGLVRVSARTVELAEADASSFLGKPGVGTHLLVTVMDTGTGMKPEVHRRLFVEPFYTTKVKHRGLGLAIVYRVLCAHRAGIQIEPVPQPGAGTLVRVVLPLAAARPPAAAGTPAGHAASAGNMSTTAVGG